MGVPYLPRKRIEEEAEITRIRAIEAGVEDSFPFDVESTIEFLFDYQLAFGAALPEGVLGMTAGRRVEISAAVESNDGRLRFTVAHEIGHIVLHIPYFENQKMQAPLFHVERSLLIIDERMEVQANKFAAALLMPAKVVSELYGARIRAGEYVRVSEAAAYFGVSHQAAEIRFKDLGILTTVSPGTPISAD